MSETGTPNVPAANEMDEAQVEAVAGGSLCSENEFLRLTANLTQAYENLVDFTSHVIERMAK